MRKRKRLVFLTLFLMPGLSPAADTGMRPGLWHMRASSGLLALAQQIPPQQMQGLSDLARQYGFTVPAVRNGAATSDVCITPQMAAQPIPPSFYNIESGCETRNAVRDGNRFSADIVCNGPDIQGQGRTEATLDGAESFSGVTLFKGIVRGLPVDDRAETSGRWTADSCPSAAR
jgi:hypothetical protein